MSPLEPLLFQIRASCLLTTALVLFTWAHQGQAGTPSNGEDLAFFENRIRPVLVEHCHDCHSAEAKTLRGELRLDTREGFLKGGKHGAIVVPGQPDQSRLILALHQKDKDLQMPPPSEKRHKLPVQVISDFVTWVKQGATFPDAHPHLTKSSSPAPWAFSPLQKPRIPAVKDQGWVKTSIDPFLLAAMEEQGVAPAPKADKLSLIRRATYDLIGLPPTPDEVDAFLSDTSPEAFSKLVERLLSSPHYGERWGRHWLDVVRYADTAGDTADYPVGLAWKYRNYVIDAFNADKPYDEFIREQIAGDILAEQEPTQHYAERVTATGYLAISRRFGFDSENYHHLTIQDTLDTLGQSVLGLGFGCARCHDHKFDPITMNDYYALYGIFASTRYPFAGSEQKPKLRAMVPLIPARESQPKWRDYDQRVAQLSDRLARRKQSVPSAIYRSLHDPDGDFEIQKDAAGGSYGVIVPPWAWEGKMSVRGSAQSPFKNLYPMGRFGVFIPGAKEDYTLSQALYPQRDATLCRQVYVNLDFRAGAAPAGAQGYHRFWVGSRQSPALEILITSEGLFQKLDNETQPLATVQSNQWHSLQLILDLEHRQFTGSLGRTNETINLGNHPLSRKWTGVINHVQLDSSLRSTGQLATLEIDNFIAQETPIAPASTTLPIPPIAAGQPNPDALAAELESLVGLDGDLEGQKEGSAPSKPWNGGPNSVVKILAEAQSPFRNVFPSGSMGIKMPHRAEYDGVGITLSGPIRTNSAGVLFVSFDFRCGSQSTGGSGSWRFYVGHGAGSSAAIELFFNENTLFHRSGQTNQVAAALHPGEWHQVQLSLNLRDKRFTGALVHPQKSFNFSGALASGWDGGIDYCFIDSYGHLPGVRPALSADNFSFSSNATPPLSTELVLRDDASSRATRQARIQEIHKLLKTFDADAKVVAEELTRLLVEGPCEMTYGVTEGTPQNARIQLRGEPDRPGDESSRGFVHSLGGSALSPETQGSGRLELARWLTRNENPLTARVMVNRIWQYHFGHGLVGTPNDFGTRGQRPTHPELMDHLATEFMQRGWSIKAMHRLIMNSAAYQASTDSLAMSVASKKTHAGLQKASPSTRLYATFESRRLSAEEIRDAILAISGDLDRSQGRGHPFPSPVTALFTQHGPYSAVYEHNQRSVYLMTQRIKRHPFLALFDGSDPNATTAERRTTTVPTQALFFLNSPFVHEKASHLASRLRSDYSTDEQRLTRLWKLTTGRSPTPTEQDEALAFLKEYQAELRAAAQPDIETAALAAYTRSLMGSNEFLHLD